jgi:hypothetical protein
MKPTIPFEFDPGASEFEEHHLQYKDVPDGQLVSWPMAGLAIHVPKHKWSPDHDDIEKANGGTVKFHGLTGFSVGSYHEFLVGELPGNMGFRMGKLEVTFGEASPLMAYLFSGYHREKYFGLWEHITTARIVGAANEEAEIAFLNAAIRYRETLGVVPRIWAMDEAFLFDGEVDAHQANVLEQAPPIREIDPVRFFYHGVSQSDAAAACIYFYRVLEYYSFLSNKKQMHKIRNDASISEDEFAKQVLQLITKEEKGPFLQLINSIADDESLKHAVAANLIKSATHSLLGEAIYAFRNSIVHGKTSYGYTLQSTSVFVEDNSLSVWRAILRSLASRAMSHYGSKLL